MWIIDCAQRKLDICYHFSNIPHRYQESHKAEYTYIICWNSEISHLMCRKISICLTGDIYVYLFSESIWIWRDKTLNNVYCTKHLSNHNKKINLNYRYVINFVNYDEIILAHCYVFVIKGVNYLIFPRFECKKKNFNFQHHVYLFN